MDRAKYHCPECGSRYMVTPSGYVACLLHGGLKMMKDWEKDQLSYLEQSAGLPSATRVSWLGWKVHGVLKGDWLWKRWHPISPGEQPPASVLEVAADDLERVILLQPWREETHENSSEPREDGPILVGIDSGGVGGAEAGPALRGDSGNLRGTLPGLVPAE